MSEIAAITRALRALADAIEDWADAQMERTAIQAEPTPPPAPWNAAKSDEVSGFEPVTTPPPSAPSAADLRKRLTELSKKLDHGTVAKAVGPKKVADMDESERIELSSRLDNLHG
jgi:hypothetical protein